MTHVHVTADGHYQRAGAECSCWRRPIGSIPLRIERDATAAQVEAKLRDLQRRMPAAWFAVAS